jgi:hypothetical protein
LRPSKIKFAVIEKIILGELTQLRPEMLDELLAPPRSNSRTASLRGGEAARLRLTPDTTTVEDNCKRAGIHVSAQSVGRHGFFELVVR